MSDLRPCSCRKAAPRGRRRSGGAAGRRAPPLPSSRTSRGRSEERLRLTGSVDHQHALTLARRPAYRIENLLDNARGQTIDGSSHVSRVGAIRKPAGRSPAFRCSRRRGWRASGGPRVAPQDREHRHRPRRSLRQLKLSRLRRGTGPCAGLATVSFGKMLWFWGCGEPPASSPVRPVVTPLGVEPDLPRAPEHVGNTPEQGRLWRAVSGDDGHDLAARHRRRPVDDDPPPRSGVQAPAISSIGRCRAWASSEDAASSR